MARKPIAQQEVCEVRVLAKDGVLVEDVVFIEPGPGALHLELSKGWNTFIEHRPDHLVKEIWITVTKFFIRVSIRILTRRGDTTDEFPSCTLRTEIDSSGIDSEGSGLRRDERREGRGGGRGESLAVEQEDAPFSGVDRELMDMVRDRTLGRELFDEFASPWATSVDDSCCSESLRGVAREGHIVNDEIFTESRGRGIGDGGVCDFSSEILDARVDCLIEETETETERETERGDV
jgi:hypothetical protein